MRILFFCDLNSIHSKSLIKRLLSSNDNYSFLIISSTYYDTFDFEGIKVINLVNFTYSSSIQKYKFSAIYSIITKINFIKKISLSFFYFMQARKMKSEVLTNDYINKYDPDIIHVFRTIPEGIILSDINYNKKIILNTWGNDFILWAKSNFLLKRQTKKLIAKIDTLITDTKRDKNIAINWGINPNANQLILPANGGISFNDKNLTKNESYKEEFKIMISRGYDGI